MLPLSDELGPQDSCGYEDRAGLWITKRPDAVAVIIPRRPAGSKAVDGRLERHLTPDQLRRRLENAFRCNARPASGPAPPGSQQ